MCLFGQNGTRIYIYMNIHNKTRERERERDRERKEREGGQAVEGEMLLVFSEGFSFIHSFIL